MLNTTSADRLRGIPMAVLFGFELPASWSPGPLHATASPKQQRATRAEIAARDAAIIEMLRRAGTPMTGEDLFDMLEMFAPEVLYGGDEGTIKARMPDLRRKGLVKRMPGLRAEWGLPTNQARGVNQ